MRTSENTHTTQLVNRSRCREGGAKAAPWSLTLSAHATARRMRRVGRRRMRGAAEVQSLRLTNFASYHRARSTGLGVWTGSL
jgi:hypothetical protein